MVDSGIDPQDVALYKAMQKSPTLFIEKMWKLTPQEKDQPFIKGKHITWQQMKVLRAVEKAITGEASNRISVASGHGIGKSTVLSWLILWYLFCHKGAQVPCTAPTSDQMHDILWKEIAVWLQKMPGWAQEKYEWSTGYLRINESPETWFARAKTARKENPEALAGVHGDHVMFCIDEASGVPEEIYKTGEGALTGENVIVIMISNPTRLLGYFYDSHHSDRENWQTFQFNSEDSPIVDQKYVDRIIEREGIDSDEYAIRVKGEFPREDAVDDKGYVPLVRQSDLRMTNVGELVGRVTIAVDPAGEGRDETIWVGRASGLAKILATEKTSTPQGIAQKTASLKEFYGVEDTDIILDSFGIGADVSHALGLYNIRCYPVNVGIPANFKDKFTNLRAEAYWNMRKWILNGGEMLYNDRWKQILAVRFRRELSGKIKMMPKLEMKKLGYPSPDAADALMLTFVRGEEVAKTYTTNRPLVNPYAKR